MSNERYEVGKAGGWSLATAERATNVRTYVLSNPDMHYFVPSALGARNKDDFKVTDLFIGCSPEGGNDQEFNRVWRKVRDKYGSTNEIFEEIHSRHISIGETLGYYGFPLLLDRVEPMIASASKSDSERDRESYRHLIPSRGEWLNGHMWAELLDFCFKDPAELIRFRKDGRFDERSYGSIRSKLRGEDRFVIPGFYGLGANGEIWTFQRDGSDVTASHIACGVNASIYRNLTNTPGVLSADPNIVDEVTKTSRLIDEMTYREYRELGNGGSKVLHRDAILPVEAIGIPLNVLYSENPYEGGTMIVSDRPYKDGEGVIGIAGKAGFASLYFRKVGMEEDTGIASQILRAIGRNGISISYIHTNTDDMSVIFGEQQLTEDREDKIIKEIERLRPKEMAIQRSISVLSAVGQGLRENGSEVSAQLATALNGASIKHGITYLSQSITVRAFLEDSNRLKDAIEEAHKALICQS